MRRLARSLTNPLAHSLARCVVERQARIVSNSWGTYARSRALLEMMDYYARAYDVTYVAAAGNEGVDNDNRDVAMYPASYNLSSMVSVAATTRLGTLAAFSNYASKGESVDIAAPGVDIVSTHLGNTYRSMSGTSFAVPLVTRDTGVDDVDVHDLQRVINCRLHLGVLQNGTNTAGVV